jgi:hypothetical protein
MLYAISFTLHAGKAVNDGQRTKGKVQYSILNVQGRVLQAFSYKLKSQGAMSDE